MEVHCIELHRHVVWQLAKARSVLLPFIHIVYADDGVNGIMCAD
jgi:hypothetical protein